MGKPIKLIGTRGKVVETEHNVIYAVVQNGKVIDSGGDISLNRAMRSSAKVIQALICIETGAADAFKFTPAELSVVASSHNGTDLQTKAVARMLKKAGLSERYLQCGAREPLDVAFYVRMCKQGRKLGRINHNCSGKHAGILSSSKHMGWPLTTYRSPKHPWNKRVFELVALFSGLPVSRVSYAIDGCGVPVIFIPVKYAALAFARYASGEGLPEPVFKATRRIIDAVNRFPDHNSGTTRFLSALYKAAPGRFIAKEGGQGVFCLGVVGTTTAIAVKVLEGTNIAYNVCEPAIMHVMESHGLLRKSEIAKLRKYRKPEILNSRDEVVGYLQVVS